MLKYDFSKFSFLMKIQRKVVVRMQLDSLDIKVLRENFSDEEIAKMDALNISKIFRYLQENNVYYAKDLLLSSLDLFLLPVEEFINKFEKN